MRKIIGMFFLFCTALGGQEIPYGQEFQINSNPLTGIINYKTISLSTGNSVVCWDSGSDYNIWGQLLSSEGEKINGEFNITSNADPYSHLDFSPLTNGGFVACWDKYLPSLTQQDYDIHCQVFSADCKKLGNEFRVNSYTNGRQDNPRIASLANGNFVICWKSYIQDDPSSDIFGQIFTPDGNKIGGEFRINTYVCGDQQFPQISALPNGGFIVLWQSYGQYGWFGQVFSSTGEKINDEFQINTIDDFDYFNYIFIPSIVLLKDRFVVIWVKDNRDASGSDINGQIISMTGERIGKQFRINSYTNNWQHNQMIMPVLNDGFWVCWDSYGQDGSGYGIYGQVFNSNGGKIGEEFLINTSVAGNQQSPLITKLLTGDFLVTWSSNGIYGQLFSSLVKKIGSEFTILADYGDVNYYRQIVPIQNNKILFCWVNYSQDHTCFDIEAKFFPSSPIHHILKPFINRTPPNDFRVKSDSITFSWNQATQQQICYPFEMEYDLFVSNDPEYSKPLVIKNIEDTIYTINNLRSGYTYFWKVLARNFYGDSLWCNSTDWGFFIPPNDSTSLQHVTCHTFLLGNSEQEISEGTSEITLNWNRASNEPTIYPPLIYYDVYMADNLDFANAQVFKTIIDTTTTIKGLTSTNYWKVLAYNTTCDSVWSQNIGKILLIPDSETLSTFLLGNPEQEISEGTSEITLNWNRATNEPTIYPPLIYYDVYMADNLDFANAQVFKTIIDTTTTIKELTSTNYWKVLAYNTIGDSVWSQDVGKIQFISNIPNQFHLYHNYPNPFNPETTIRFDLPEVGYVKIAVHDITGKLVKVLASESKSAGSYSVNWDGRDTAGKLMPSGIYFCRMEAKTAAGKMFVKSVKMGLVR
jgi:hypothetical protein